MASFFGSRTQIPGSRRRLNLFRPAILIPVLAIWLMGTVQWCRPDGIGPQPIESFVFALQSLRTNHSQKVRILHFGDSHIASDTESSVVRSYLQSIFGDGGAGLTLPWEGPRLTSLNITYGSTTGWQRARPSYYSPVDDTGLSLSYIETEYPNQSAWIEATGSDFRVYYLTQPNGGAAEFLLDGAPLGQRSMNAGFPKVEVAHFQTGTDAPHRFEIRTLDSGKVRILGVGVEKVSPGIVYSALGLVGARAEYLLKCREETFAQQIANEQPDLILLGYGTNESSGSYLDENAYETALETIISRMRRAAPAALVVLLTPPDRGDIRPAQAQRIERILQAVIAAQRDVAARTGAVVIDVNRAMGGPGSAGHWANVQPALARPDMTHFTNEGYNLLGRYIVGGIMKLYDTGTTTAGSSLSSSLEGYRRSGEILPPLYPASNGTSLLSTRARGGFSPEPSPSYSQILYFLKDDGQVIVTNDLATIDTRRGHVISGEEAGCLLRGKTPPCDNVSRW